jgi:hypothetical protein
MEHFLIQREFPIWKDGGESRVQRLALDKRSLNSESVMPRMAWESTVFIEFFHFTVRSFHQPHPVGFGGGGPGHSQNGG